MIRWFAAFWLAALLILSPAVAQDFPARPAGPLLDEAALLSPSQSIDLSSKLVAFNERSGRSIVVATVESLGGEDISRYATALGRSWGIGDAKDDVGVLLLVAPTERKVWIATGYGGDDYLTDAMSGTIIREVILPRFKAGDMGGGIIAGTDAIIRQLELPPDEAAKRAQQAETQARDSSDDPGMLPVIIIVIVFFVIISILRGVTRRSRRYRRGGSGFGPAVVLWGLDELSRGSRGGGIWGGSGGFSGGFGGGGGGGFGGFGGGSFGGGGAGGSW